MMSIRAVLAALGSSPLLVAALELERYHVPSFDLSDLLGRRRRSDLSAALGSTGLIAVTGVGSRDDIRGGLQALKTDALGGLCDCVSSSAAELMKIDSGDTVKLPDGMTTRSSIATATAGTTPLPLPAKEINAACGVDLSDAMEEVRDLTAEASRAFVTALDGLVEDAFLTSLEANGLDEGNRHRPALMRSNPDAGFERKYASVSSILDGARHLEHFHVYSKNAEKSEAVKDGVGLDHNALNLHTDAGLFLSFLPAVSCDNEVGGSDESFLVSVPGSDQSTGLHKLQVAVFPPNSVAIMLGIGSEGWLNTPLDSYGKKVVPLKATRHAVQMNHGQRRAWYGMMHLVPDNAIVMESPPRTFADMRKSMASSSKRADKRHFGDLDEEDANEGAVSIGCGAIQTSYPSFRPDEVSSPLEKHRGRRRLQMVSDASECNNRTNFYCWMSCLEIPDASNAARRIDDGQALYCLDPATFAASDHRVAPAVKQCTQAGVPGAAMNEACMGSWQTEVPGVPYQEVNVDLSVKDDHEDELNEMHMGEEPYCYGSTSMYMKGFQWIGTTCVVYLFPSWVLSTAGKLAGACVGTIVAGAALEGIIHSRRKVMLSLSPSWYRLAASTVMYGLQLTIGYLVMLVVMTYSGPLFMSVIFGLMIGHASFNYKLLVNPGEGGGGENSGAGNTVPEGSTPCCQNNLGTTSSSPRQNDKNSASRATPSALSGLAAGGDSVTEGTISESQSGAPTDIASEDNATAASGSASPACCDAKTSNETQQGTCCSGAVDRFEDELDV